MAGWAGGGWFGDWFGPWFGPDEADPNAMWASIGGSSSISATLTTADSAGSMTASLAGESSVFGTAEGIRSGGSGGLPRLRFRSDQEEQLPPDDEELILEVCTAFVFMEEQQWDLLKTA